MDLGTVAVTAPKDLRQFAAFVAVAKAGSISGGGTELGWSDATINYHLTALEKLVTAALFTRSKKGCTLTEIGVQLLPAALNALNTAANAVEEVRELAGNKQQRLRLGAFPTAAANLLPRITRRLKQAPFKLQVHLSEITVLNSMVISGQLDAALSYTAPNVAFPGIEKLFVTPLLTDPVLLALPKTHRFAAAYQDALSRGKNFSVTNEDLLSMHAEHWLSGSTPGDPLDEAVEAKFQEAGLVQNVKISTDDYTVALGLVSAGIVVGLVPQLACKNVPAGVTLVPLADKNLCRQISLLTQKAIGRTQAQAERLQVLTATVLDATTELQTR